MGVSTPKQQFRTTAFHPLDNSKANYSCPPESAAACDKRHPGFLVSRETNGRQVANEKQSEASWHPGSVHFTKGKQLGDKLETNGAQRRRSLQGLLTSPIEGDQGDTTFIAVARRTTIAVKRSVSADWPKPKGGVCEINQSHQEHHTLPSLRSSQR